MANLNDCPDAAGSINNPSGSGVTPTTPGTYVPPDFCTGTFTISQGECADRENAYQANVAAEALRISGAPVNVFKLLGVHEQGKLIDLTGNGNAISSSGTPSNAFDTLAGPWTSDEAGAAVTGTPAYIGYDFGVTKTSFGQQNTEPGDPAAEHITTIRIQQTDPLARALQIRVERSTGEFFVDPLTIQYTGTGNGAVGAFVQGVHTVPGMFMVSAVSSTQFSVMFITAESTEVLGVATVNTQFNSLRGSFTISSGSTPFVVNDMFTIPVQLRWLRVDVVNLPNFDAPAAVRIKQSAASRYWRIVPMLFTGVSSGAPWSVDKLELFNYQATTLDDIQDTVFMENRDRDYASSSIQLKASYTPFDSVSDLSKFGFQMADIYSFTVSFADMVRALGRPIVIGDVLDLPSEIQYDQNLKAVRKFLEVSDVGWAADGYTTGWQPVLYRFQAQQLIPSQEHRDILGTVDTQKYTIDDSTFFTGAQQQIQTAPLTVSEANEAEAALQVPRKGTNIREEASGTNRFSQPATYDGTGLYVEDGLPPDGLPYDQGFNLPDVAGQVDGAYYRLEYPPQLKIAARLYKFSIMKNKWIYVETDRRSINTSHLPSQREIFNATKTIPLDTKKI